MKSLTEQLWFEVPGCRGFVNITDTVAGLVRKSGVQEGLCLINAMHITATIILSRYNRTAAAFMDLLETIEDIAIPNQR